MGVKKVLYVPLTLTLSLSEERGLVYHTMEDPMETPNPFWTARAFSYPFRGMLFIFRHLRLLGYVAVPVCINTILFALLAWLVGTHYTGWLQQLLPSKETWYWAILFYVLLVLVGMVLLLVGIYAFTLIGNIILGPFNDFISEKVEMIYAGTATDEPFSMKALFSDILRSLKVQVAKMLLYLGGLIVLLVIHLIPIVGTVLYPVLILLYTLFFLGWEYCDYSMERWKYSFRRKLRISLKNAFAFAGFGAGASLMLFIPLVNLMTIPVCAVGATLLFCDLRKEGRLLSPVETENKIQTPPTD